MSKYPIVSSDIADGKGRHLTARPWVIRQTRGQVAGIAEGTRGGRAGSGNSGKGMARRELENLLAALRQTGFRVSGKGGAAELPGINPGTLASRLKALGIDKRAHLG